LFVCHFAQHFAIAIAITQVRLEFIESGFTGLLPTHFAPFPRGVRTSSREMNIRIGENDVYFVSVVKL
jgi:hypothetical protein